MHFHLLVLVVIFNIMNIKYYGIKKLIFNMILNFNLVFYKVIIGNILKLLKVYNIKIGLIIN
jgi:hypothetical protein